MYVVLLRFTAATHQLLHRFRDALRQLPPRRRIRAHPRRRRLGGPHRPVVGRTAARYAKAVQALNPCPLAAGRAPKLLQPLERRRRRGGAARVAAGQQRRQQTVRGAAQLSCQVGLKPCLPV